MKENEAVFTCDHILHGTNKIRYIHKDIEDGTFTFLCEKDHSAEEGRILAISEIIAMDNRVKNFLEMEAGETVDLG